MEVVKQISAEPVETRIRQVGKYELIQRIGVGGMAEVYLARMRGPMNFQKVCVVKMIHPDLATEQEFLQMLLDEARVSALIKHPRVVDIYDLGHADGRYFIAMEYLDGAPLSALLAWGARCEPLDVHSTARIIADAAEGLHAAHELTSISGRCLEVVHRDVSPGNIVVLYDGNVKIVDFGIAKARGRLANSGMRKLKGKSGYMSPEQCACAAIDRRSDVFSLGVVMWEALTVRRLFPTNANRDAVMRVLPPPSAHRPEVPPELDAVCLKALAEDPADRFQTASEFKRAIEDILHEAAYYRESDAIPRYMRWAFGERREQRAQVMRRLSTSTGEHELPAEVAASARAITAEGTPPHATPRPTVQADEPASDREPELTRSRGRWRVAAVALAVVLVGAGAATYVLGQSDAAAEAEAPHDTAPVAAQPVPVTTSMDPKATPEVEPAPAPEATPEPEPTPEPEATPEPKPEPTPTKSADELYAEGAELFVNGDLSQAKRRFKQALHINRRHAPSHRGLGLVYQALGKHGRAASELRTYLKLRPNARDAASIRSRLERLQQ